MSNGADLQSGTLPPFPTWPPPSGGAPVTTPEQGPILNPYPYGKPQGANISTGSPAPAPLATGYPYAMPPLNGQNQKQSLPVWPWPARMNVLPDKASPLISQIQPPPMMGPGTGIPAMESGPLAGTPAPAKTFPAGSFIDGYGNLITPMGVTREIGGLGN